MTPEQAHARAAVVMVGRLVRHRGLTVTEALTAVDQRRRREPGPHTDLVTAEAEAYVQEFRASLRALGKALQPIAQQIAEHAAASSTPARRRDRPAWASTYGPPPRRRSSR
ncbi:hypothetical protein [Actinacidiphila sp. ITFR-21]|uniref:hypothetical protein n=1 Tax=Actinacidiphila sp. ITFR-21 TaxID=3075199 RepID=UPI00288A8292|nr:hypothetical protein [Streptomyces sp. ITFR-21]WNI20353.1 hypothetical protein RLT57_32640 [Streptomyces sp. ITFR-21]